MWNKKKNKARTPEMVTAATTRTNDDDYDDDNNTFFMVKLYFSFRYYNYVKW